MDGNCEKTKNARSRHASVSQRPRIFGSAHPSPAQAHFPWMRPKSGTVRKTVRRMSNSLHVLKRHHFSVPKIACGKETDFHVEKRNLHPIATTPKLPRRRSMIVRELAIQHFFTGNQHAENLIRFSIL